VNPCHQTSFFEMLKYFVLFAALSAAVRAQDNLMDDLLEQEMELPCTPKPCVPICKPVTKYVSYGAFKLPYTENVCVDDKACLNANAKCIATLQAAMKAAEAAEKDMIAKSKAANSAKATKAQKDAAAASKKAEEAAAKKALDGAKAAFDVAEKETATAKAHSVAAAAAFAAKDKVMNTRLVEYEKAKAGHLNAQKAYSNAKGEAAKAADAYAAAVKAHCDAEAVHAAAVENIGHGHLKKDECKKHETGTGGKWVKGANGATCDATCKARGKTCDVSELNKLTSNAKVGAAFKQAGYTCKGYHAPRNYPGTPFSTARSDDCAPVIPGKTVTCSGNSHGHHAALCYCK